ncbi:MAG: ribulose-phosphate 3-epimerase [Bacteroidota bacterium]
MSEIIISPSLLSANFLQLGKDIEMLNQSEAQWIHIDVMDGVFVPNISFGMPVIKHIRQATKKVLDVHLMIVDPDRYIETFAAVGADVITVHYEACTHLNRVIAKIKENKMKAGVVLNPHTPVSLLKDMICDLDLVLLMSVNPGFGGQKFIENTYNKIAELKEMISAKGSKCIIQIDGGVDGKNAKKLVETGADALVAGNYVFSSSNPMQTISELKNCK